MFLFKRKIDEIEPQPARIVELGRDVIVLGSLYLTEGLEKNFYVEDTLNVDINAHITGSVTTTGCIIDGKVTGNIICAESLELGPTAVIEGTITAKAAVINAGCIVNGEVVLDPLLEVPILNIKIAEAKNYDFIFDKSSDLTMLFSNKRFDISDQVIRILNRTDKREQLTKKQLKDQEVQESKENAIDENPAMADRQKVLDERKAAREKLIEDRRLEQEAKKKEYDDRRKAILEEREAKKNGTVSEPAKSTQAAKTTEAVKTDGTTAKPAAAATTTTAEPAVDKAAERQKLYEQRKKELEERRKKILEEREAAKKAREAETQKTNTTNN